MRYFVTGATGFIGGYVARQLRERGDEVVALVRSPSKAADLAALGVDLVPGDITDPSSMRGPMSGVDGVFHIAGWYKLGARDTSPATAINIDGTRNVLGVARDAQVGKVVYTSTLAVNSDTHGRVVDETYRFTGRHLTEYDRTKAAAHEIAHEFMAQGMPLVTVMPGLVYGPGDTSSVRKSLRLLMAGRMPVVPDRTAYSWAHVIDVADGHLRAMDRGRTGEDYIIAGPAHTLAVAMRSAAAVLRVRPPQVVPHQVFDVLAPASGIAERVLPVPQLYRAESLRVLAGVTYLGSAAKAERELGFHARPLREGLPATLEVEQALPE